KAISLGADPIRAISMSTYQTARFFGLRDRGAIAPNYIADLVVLSDLKEIKVKEVYKSGKLAADGTLDSNMETTHLEKTDKIYRSFNLSNLRETDFYLHEPANKYHTKVRVIDLVPNQITKRERIVNYETLNNGI